MITSGVVEHDWKPFFPDRIPRRDAARQTPLSTAFLDRRRFLSCKTSTLNRITTSTRLTGHSLYWIQLQVCVTSAPHKTWFWLCYQLSSTGKGRRFAVFLKIYSSTPFQYFNTSSLNQNVIFPRLTGDSLYWVQLRFFVISVPRDTWFWLYRQLSCTGQASLICDFFKYLFNNALLI